MSEYKKCPMCGGNATYICYVKKQERTYSVGCRECKLSTDVFDRLEDAKEAWNERYSPDGLSTRKLNDKRVYICSPYSGNMKFNIMEAQRISRQVVLAGGLPIAPHLLFTQFLDDNIDEERHLAFKMNEKFLDLCDLVVAKNGTISDGMRRELDHIYGTGKEVIWVD